MSDDDNLGRCPTEDEKRSWTGPAKTTTVVNGLTFRSNFDSGNLMKVVLPAEQGGVGGIYQLWTARCVHLLDHGRHWVGSSYSVQP